MKYWKKINGDCGTRANNDVVPDSVDITKVEYNAYVDSAPKNDDKGTALLDKIDGCSTLAQLKTLLKEVLVK